MCEESGYVQHEDQNVLCQESHGLVSRTLALSGSIQVRKPLSWGVIQPTFLARDNPPRSLSMKSDAPIFLESAVIWTTLYAKVTPMHVYILLSHKW